MAFDKPWVMRIEFLIYGGLSVLLFLLGGLIPLLGGVLMLVPLQILYKKRGREVFIPAVLVAFGLIILSLLVSNSAGTEEIVQESPENSGLRQSVPGIISFIYLLHIALLFGGLMVMNFLSTANFRNLHKLLIIAVASWAIALVVFLYLELNPQISGELDLYLNLQILGIFRIAGTGSAENVEVLLNEFRAADKIWALLNFLYGYSTLITLTAGWWLGSLLAGKFFRLPVDIPAAKEFHVPDKLIWVLIGCLALVMLSVLLKIIFPLFTALNFLVIVLFIYSIQGIGILKFLRDKQPIRLNILRFLPLLLLGALLLIPQLIPFLLILIPGLGISEIWIKFRKVEEETQ